MNAKKISSLLSVAALSVATMFGAGEASAKGFSKGVQNTPDNSLGIGVGLAFGVAGFSIDHAVSDRLTLTAAVGALPFVDEPLYSVGAKFSLSTSTFWQPRISVLYGTNALAESTCSGLTCFDPEYTAYEGFSVGIGQRFVLGFDKRHAVDLDFFMPFNSSEVEDAITSGRFEETNDGQLKLSIGYRFNF